MRKGVLYESVKRFVKTRKEDLDAFFTTSLRMRKFEISCCAMHACIEIKHKNSDRKKSFPCFVENLN